MACDAAGLVDKETQGSPQLEKLARLREELCLQSNRKAVVFSQWALMTEMVESLVRGMGLGCVRLHGGVPSSKRSEPMEKFQNDDAVQVFIMPWSGRRRRILEGCSPPGRSGGIRRGLVALPQKRSFCQILVIPSFLPWLGGLRF